jgi:hypothetical protein
MSDGDPTKRLKLAFNLSLKGSSRRDASSSFLGRAKWVMCVYRRNQIPISRREGLQGIVAAYSRGTACFQWIACEKDRTFSRDLLNDQIDHIDELAGVETVFMVERNMCNAVMRGCLIQKDGHRDGQHARHGRD